MPGVDARALFRRILPGMTDTAVVSRNPEYPRPSHTLVHISDTHLLGARQKLYGTLDSQLPVRHLFDSLVASGARVDAFLFSGDLADKGEPDAYRLLREVVEPAAELLGAEVVWAMGNHDDRGAFREGLLRVPASADPVNRVVMLGGLRVIVLDTSVPGHHHGELDAEQLVWLAGVLSVPALLGTILVMHHPPVPCVLDLAVSVELRDQSALAAVLAGSDVRTIVAGHLHYSTSALFAGVPVSVASATCYTQDLAAPVGATRARDSGQAYNLVHVFEHTVMHSVVPLDPGGVLDFVSAAETSRRLDEDGVRLDARRTHV